MTNPPTADQVAERVNRMIQAMGLFDLTDRDRQLLALLAKEQETADAAANLFGRLTRPGR